MKTDRFILEMQDLRLRDMIFGKVWTIQDRLTGIEYTALFVGSSHSILLGTRNLMEGESSNEQ